MLKAVLIGTSGHFHYAMTAMGNGAQCEVVAYASGPSGEEMNGDVVKNCGKHFDDYIKMLDETKPDIAIVNPHFSDIAQCSVDCLERGINIFCEKPISTTWDGLADIEKALKTSDARICAMMGMRTFPSFSKLKDLIEDNALGDIRLIHAQKSYKMGSREEYYKKRETSGGLIPWVGSHSVDMAYWLSGRKSYKSVSAFHSVKSNAGHGEMEASAAMIYQMEDEIIATMNVDYLRPATASTHGDDRIRIIGSKNYADIKDEKLYLGDSEIELSDIPNIFAEFCAELLGKGKCSITTQDSLYITRICLTSRDSADSGKSIKFREHN